MIGDEEVRPEGGVCEAIRRYAKLVVTVKSERRFKWER